MTRKKQRQIEKPRFPPGLLFFLALGCSGGLLHFLHTFWDGLLQFLLHLGPPFGNGLLSSAGSAFQPPWVCSPSTGKPRESGTGFPVLFAGSHVGCETDVAIIPAQHPKSCVQIFSGYFGRDTEKQRIRHRLGRIPDSHEGTEPTLEKLERSETLCYIFSFCHL